MADELTAELAKKLLRYDPETGKLFWRKRTADLYEGWGRRDPSWICANWNSQFAGKEAFTYIDSVGYRMGSIFDKRYRAHRVIWLMVHGEFPQYQIDHINGIRTDNRICNLRAVSNKENHKNAKLSRNNTSGTTGVYFHKPCQKWAARICVNARTKHLGLFADKEDAIDARKLAEARYGFHPNHGRKIAEKSS